MEWIALEGSALKARLDEFVSPQMLTLGLTWRGDYRWVEQGHQSIRRIVDLRLLKSRFSAVTGWGLSLSFVPTISGARLAYHRTFKSARPDLFEWPDSYSASFAGSISYQRNDLRIEAFDRSLKDHMNEVLPAIISWFDR